MSNEATALESPHYYLCRVLLKDETTFVAWYSADRDGFLRDGAGRVVAADTPERLAEMGCALGVKFENKEPVNYDFDYITNWCTNPRPDGIDCSSFLNAWNLLDDLAGLHAGTDILYVRLSREAINCYDRMFWGSNPSVVTPLGERFEPNFSAAEIETIRDVFRAGLAILEAEILESGHFGDTSRTGGSQREAKDNKTNREQLVSRKVRQKGQLMDRHCCEDMRREVERACDKHPNRFDCPDCIIEFRPKSRQ